MFAFIQKFSDSLLRNFHGLIWNVKFDSCIFPENSAKSIWKNATKSGNFALFLRFQAIVLDNDASSVLRNDVFVCIVSKIERKCPGQSWVWA
jgi:hypothetical protein